MRTPRRSNAFRTVQTWLAGLVALSLLLAVPPAARPVAADNSADTSDPTKIKITVPIDILEESAVSSNVEFDALIKRWVAGINRWWNRDGRRFSYRCPNGSNPREVVFIPDIEVRSIGSWRPESHVVVVVESAGDEWLSHVNAPSGYDPAYDYTVSYWASGEDSKVIAHEFGHLLGLPDEYEWTPECCDKNNNGRRDPDEPTQPKPQFRDGSIMAEPGGRVLQRHIDAAVANNVPPDKLGCDGQQGPRSEGPPPDDTEVGEPGGDPGGAGPGPESGPGGGPPSGEVPGPDPGSAAGPAPDFGCELMPTTLHRNAVMQDVSGVRVACRLRIVGCAEPIELNVTVNARAGEKCPWFDGTTVADRVPGPSVCCPALRRCPNDLDCDNVPDQEDPLPLDPSNGRPRSGTIPRLEGLLLSFLDLPAPRLDQACPLLRI